MALLPKYDGRAPNRGSLPVDENTGAAETFLSFARGMGQLTGDLLTRAARVRKKEAQADAARLTTSVQMPGVDFAFKPDAGGAPSGKPNERAAAAKAYLMSAHGLAAHRAAGIVGNLMQESSLNTGARNPGDGSDGTDSIGMAQWNSGRARALHAFAASKGKPVGDFNTQLDFVMHELGGSEGAAGRALAAATTVEEATAAMIGFERPQGWSEGNPRGGHGWQNRLGYAQALAGEASGPPVTPVAGSAPGGRGVAVTLTGAAGPVPQVQGDTIYAEAFNAAAIDIYGNRLETAMRSQMDAVALQHEGDPAGLAGALDALRAGYLKDQPAELAGPLSLSFEREKQGLTLAAVKQMQERVESENLAAYEGVLTTRYNSAQRLALQANAGTPEEHARTERAIAAEMDAMWRAIDASPQTPLAKARAKRDVTNGVLSARVIGGFDNITDPAARAEYVAAFQEKWKSGDGWATAMDADTYEKVNAELIRKAKADEVEAQKRAAVVDKAIDTQIGFLKKGFSVTQSSRDTLKGQVAQTGDTALAGRMDFLDSLSDWQRAHVAGRPEVIDAQVAQLRERIMKDGATDAALTSLDVMESLANSMRQGLKVDPLGWAQQAGVATIEALDFSDGDTLTASLAGRVADAVAVARHYGVEPRFFTPAEADTLKKTMREQPLALPALASSLAAGLGADAPAALAEISKDAPVLAHLGGLVHATGDQRLAIEVGEALELRRQPGYKSLMPTDNRLQSAAIETLAGALGADMAVIGQVTETAAAAFERRATSRGLRLEDFAEPGSAGRQLFAEVLDETLGAREIDGVKYGGLTPVNGFLTVAPPDIEADSLQDLLTGISADDLIFQEGIGSANGIAITPAQLAGGRLIRQGDGRYRIALGDVESGDPRFVPDASGGIFELDMRMLAKTQIDRGAGTGDAPEAPPPHFQTFRYDMPAR